MAHRFRSTYGSISLKDLKNIYSGPERVNRIELACQESKLNRKLEKREKMIEEVNKMTFEKRYRKRLNDYVPEFKTYLPKAPAFREADNTQVDEIVGRLYKTQERRPRKSAKSCDSKQSRSSNKLTYSDSELNMVYERLHQAETQTFRNRQVFR
ncbi:unnamed protein product [Mytilus edulis]|uniref:Uncharacterized protein n=1 Tax=Mytilus edulis TaxID=6550 RepID=A0A8S3SHU5_MYTED|nr:unnamed protein product [Mytilus edulis]